MKFKHKFYAECTNCSYRHPLSVQRFDTAEQEVNEKKDACQMCDEEGKEFEIICITKKS